MGIESNFTFGIFDKTKCISIDEEFNGYNLPTTLDQTSEFVNSFLDKCNKMLCFDENWQTYFECHCQYDYKHLWKWISAGKEKIVELDQEDFHRENIPNCPNWWMNEIEGETSIVEIIINEPDQFEEDIPFRDREIIFQFKTKGLSYQEKILLGDIFKEEFNSKYSKTFLKVVSINYGN